MIITNISRFDQIEITFTPNQKIKNIMMLGSYEDTKNYFDKLFYMDASFEFCEKIIVRHSGYNNNNGEHIKIINLYVEWLKFNAIGFVKIEIASDQFLSKHFIKFYVENREINSKIEYTANYDCRDFDFDDSEPDQDYYLENLKFPSHHMVNPIGWDQE